MSETWTKQALAVLVERLERDLGDCGSALVAFSGGVDSAVVSALAHRALGSRSVAVTAAAETLAGRELEDARRQAREIGIEHRVVTYSELDEPEFVRNPRHRCYVCQRLRMGTLTRLAQRLGYAVVCDGTNASDVGHERPGLRAVREQGVVSPLLRQGVDKATTRGLAKYLGLRSWDRPANACLSSRIPHGQVVTLQKLRRVEKAEGTLLARGFRVVRVRHDGGAARVEVGQDELSRLASEWDEVVAELEGLGFEGSWLDPAGYRYGGADRPDAGVSESSR